MAPFQNPRYEYLTREHRLRVGLTSKEAQEEQKLEADGWLRIWADKTMEGVFVVYRRDRVGPEVRSGGRMTRNSSSIVVHYEGNITGLTKFLEENLQDRGRIVRREARRAKESLLGRLCRGDPSGWPDQVTEFYQVFYARSDENVLPTPQSVVTKDYEEIGRVEAEDLAQLFRKMSRVHSWTFGAIAHASKKPLRLRPMTVGDLAVDQSGVAHYCSFVAPRPPSLFVDKGCCNQLSARVMEINWDLIPSWTTVELVGPATLWERILEPV